MLATWIIIVLCGVGTLMLRWWPTSHARDADALRRHGGAARRWLMGIGPAAIASLLVVAAWHNLSVDVGIYRGMAIVLALAVVAVVHRLRRGGVAIPTFAGAIVYGVLMHLG